MRNALAIYESFFFVSTIYVVYEESMVTVWRWKKFKMGWKKTDQKSLQLVEREREGAGTRETKDKEDAEWEWIANRRKLRDTRNKKG